MILNRDLEDLRKIKGKQEGRFVLARDPKYNRIVLEQKLADILVSPEINSERDNIKFLSSGINGIMARIASKNKIAIGIDFNLLRKDNNLGQKLARIRQNIKLVRKARGNLAITGFRDIIGARALLTCLGASSEQARKAISF